MTMVNSGLERLKRSRISLEERAARGLTRDYALVLV